MNKWMILPECRTETNHRACKQHRPDRCHGKELLPDIAESCIPEEHAGT
jgi:hypothetical protein